MESRNVRVEVVQKKRVPLFVPIEDKGDGNELTIEVIPIDNLKNGRTFGQLSTVHITDFGEIVFSVENHELALMVPGHRPYYAVIWDINDKEIPEKRKIN